jgi:thiol-disulfide isomerase/thioredoxin
LRRIVHAFVALVMSLVPHVAVAQVESLPRADLTWSMQTLDGSPVTLASFAGRVIIVNSWATWCEPCVAELQSFARLRSAIPDTGLVFVMVAPQAREPVASFVRRRSVTLPVYLERTPAPAVYRFEAVPTTWIIDRAGRIAFRHPGARRWDTPEIRRSVVALLAEAPTH